MNTAKMISIVLILSSLLTACGPVSPAVYQATSTSDVKATVHIAVTASSTARPTTFPSDQPAIPTSIASPQATIKTPTANITPTQDQPLDGQPTDLPKGEIAYIGEDNNIWILSLPESKARRLTSEGTYYEVTWSPYGDRLGFVRETSSEPAGRPVSEIGLIDATGAKQRLVVNSSQQLSGQANASVPHQLYHNLRWSPYAHTLYWLQRPTQTSQPECASKAYSIAVISEVGSVAFGPGAFALYFDGDTFDVSPDGSQIALSSCAPGAAENAQRGIKIASGFAFMKPEIITDLSDLTTGDQTDPAWSLDGKSLAFISDGKIAIYDRQMTNLSFIGPTGESPKWSPDGNWLVFSNGDDVLMVDKAGTTKPFSIAKGKSPDWKSTYIPSGAEELVGFVERQCERIE